MDRLGANLRVVMKDTRYSSQPKMARATGVSQSHIGNILRADQYPSLKIVERLASGLGMDTWQLFLPTEVFEKGVDSRFNSLLTDFLGSDLSGQDVILKVAETQAAYRAIDSSPISDS